MTHPTEQQLQTVLFQPGMIGSAAFRIPSLLTTQRGTVIAGIDVRWRSARDNPNHISIAIRRSFDHGITWNDVQLLVQYPGEGSDGSAAIDSSLLEDRETGTLWMLFSHTPGGIGLWNSQQSIGFDSEGHRLLYDERNNNEYVLQAGGEVFDLSGALTGYTVSRNGDVWSEGVCCGNIYLKEDALPRSLLEARTSFLQVIKSDDDGMTWSEPIELNPQVKKPWMRFIGAGPGRGVQLRQGANKGRLVFPVYFSNPQGILSNAVIYSDDHGKIWRMGQSPNEGRIWDGRSLSAETADSKEAQLTESQVVERNNGELVIYMRNHAGWQRTAVSASTDGGETWGEVHFDHTLVDPICQSTVIKYSDLGDGKERFIWANPADAERRTNGTVRLSEDGGRTWPYSRALPSEQYIYSCLTELANGNVGLLYEGDGGAIVFNVFPLEWVKGEEKA